ncbi:DEAD/DEAH box helicase [Rhodoblastus sp.]|uniref:DEAD/DEAH box helicase n=2 Tax=Rhodoblastus sp. TaxID=1962975 RepID=UPI003F970E9B
MSNGLAGQLLSPVKSLEAVKTRLTEALLARHSFSHPALAAEIRRMLNSSDTDAGALAQEPVIEAAFPYVTGDQTLGQLAGQLLHPKVVDALAASAPGRNYVFPKTLKPYAHQIASWRLLRDPTPQSVLVTSGTGSGKTECFLLPLLDDLAREAEMSSRLSGVRAIALYPLNALIASQEERLREWTAPFKGAIRFGLYNGLMEEDIRGASQRPEQVEDRRTLRADPPPILVTNITMLEYMTVRRQDRPLLEASSGKLRWIILDEAHSYIGSRAAEVALLIRRVLLAFNVKPTDVRFVATSATIGEGGDVEAKLKAFLRDVAGVPDARVHVVVGHRRKPELPKASAVAALSAADLKDQAKVAANPVVQGLIKLFDQGPVRWSHISEAASKSGVDGEELAQALASKPAPDAEPLLPMRAHGFIRGVEGVFSCLNPQCAGKIDGWPFGAILPEAVQACPHCRSTVLQIERCHECGEPFLRAIERERRLLIDAKLPDDDEFAADSENEGVVLDEDDEPVAAEDSPDIKRRLGVRDLAGGHIIHVDFKGGEVRDSAREGTTALTSYDFDKCPACDCEKGGFDPFRSGAPFLIGNAAPVLLDGLAPRSEVSAQTAIPDGGRQLLSFTDSRQGTARYAASLQNGSERNFIRAAIYHAVQDTLRPAPRADGQVAGLNEQIKGLEQAIASMPSMTMLGDTLEKLRKERDALISPAATGLNWATLREQLSLRPEINELMIKVWRFREERFLKSTRDFTEFLMLRELARRPKSAVSLETYGLACLRYHVIEQIPESRVPEILKDKGLGIDQYRQLLMAIVSINVRGPFAIRTDRENIHWFSGHVFQRRLIPPNSEPTAQDSGASRERGRWPSAGTRSSIVRLLERVLSVNASEGRGRADVTDLLQQAWDDLLPLFAQPGAGAYYALDFNKVNVAPVKRAYLCPVTRRLSDISFAGLSPYGFGQSSRFASQPAAIFEMPLHPNPFLLAERGGADVVHEWLQNDAKVEQLRQRGLWTNIHDRVALESPYFRAAEHSAQQPPKRLRAYEKQFKEGQINILNCSTTMEMGVDIGSVSTVMMTNVPPSLANYRQRVGRAGRRGQGFALALTYARPSPLDRETFRDPVAYLNRHIEAPKVTLDSLRIVQRHVNALLLAHWFKLANGEALKTKIGDFFGCSAGIGNKQEAESAAARFQKWAQQPSVVSTMGPLVAILVRGSVLENDQGLFARAAQMMKDAEDGFVVEWQAVQAQAAGMDRQVAQKSIGFQLKRMCEESLLGELADRGVLPGHGFPTDVVSFVNKDKPDADEGDENGEDRFRRRSFPSRNLDLAIRDYAPGAEIVLDGLVYESAGVTLNWKRPAGDSDVREIQSLKWFWECPDCGEAGTTHLMPVDCPACRAALAPENISRYLRPAGFTVDMMVKPHAEIEEVKFIEPEPERVSTRGASWQPFPAQALGRVRSSNDGLVFYASRGGPKRSGYTVCLECGRAEADRSGVGTPGFQPLKDHRPLRFTRADADGKCPGNGHTFSVLTSLALGHEITTDVVEIQPAGLASEKAAWALASAIREALARRLGIESSELGIAVTPHRTSIGGVTHSMFVYDRAAGGAGFAPRILDFFPEILKEARAVLDCRQPGCVTCCSSCVLTSDLATRSTKINRKAALQFLDDDLLQVSRPAAEDMAGEGATLCLDVADELVTISQAGSKAILFAGHEFDPSALNVTRMRYLIDRLHDHGATVTVCLDSSVFAAMEPLQKLGLRDAAIRHGLELISGERRRFENGALPLAASSGGRIWASRDQTAAVIGNDWGVGRAAPVVWLPAAIPSFKAIDLESLLPPSDTRFVNIGVRLDGPSMTFADRFLALIEPELAQAGFWRPGKLTAIEYNDRFVHSPLAAMLTIKGIDVMVKKLGGGAGVKTRIATQPLREWDGRMPFRLHNDWMDDHTRADVVSLMAKRAGLQLTFDVGPCAHSRTMRLIFADGEALIAFDQGFGFLKTSTPTPFDFRVGSADQERKLSTMNTLLASQGSSFFVVTPG